MESNEYDKLPVIYCKHCLYLGNTKTKFLFNKYVEYCPHCYGTEFVKSSIGKWEQLFEEKYKQGKFLKLKKSWKEIMEE
jgi:hypothetical protein